MVSASGANTSVGRSLLWELAGRACVLGARAGKGRGRTPRPSCSLRGCAGSRGPGAVVGEASLPASSFSSLPLWKGCPGDGRF